MTVEHYARSSGGFKARFIALLIAAAVCGNPQTLDKTHAETSRSQGAQPGPESPA